MGDPDDSSELLGSASWHRGKSSSWRDDAPLCTPVLFSCPSTLPRVAKGLSTCFVRNCGGSAHTLGLLVHGPACFYDSFSVSMCFFESRRLLSPALVSPAPQEASNQVAPQASSSCAATFVFASFCKSHLAVLFLRSSLCCPKIVPSEVLSLDEAMAQEDKSGGHGSQLRVPSRRLQAEPSHLCVSALDVIGRKSQQHAQADQDCPALSTEEQLDAVVTS